ncbi:unnamed protein product [Effrenium voratum]|nr:unnamed protein product [Effrenium voratum]
MRPWLVLKWASRARVRRFAAGAASQVKTLEPGGTLRVSPAEITNLQDPAECAAYEYVRPGAAAEALQALAMQRLAPEEMRQRALPVLRGAKMSPCPSQRELAELAAQNSKDSKNFKNRKNSKRPKSFQPLALLVDGDQFGPAHCELLLAYLERSFDVRVRRIYTAPSKAQLWRQRLASAKFEAIEVPRWTGGQKDPVDIEIAMDVMQFAITKTLPSIAIACKDVDYARVFQRGREHGLDMLHVVPASAEAQPAIPPEIEAACSQTLVVKPGPDGACVGSAFEESEAEGEVVDRLASLGYWDPESALATRFRSLTLRQAVACFLHVNREHGLDRFKPFYPVRTVMPSLHEFLLQKQDWSSKPEGMLCLTGLKGDVTHQQMRFGSWPEVDYFAGASRNLVRRVLRAFGYLDSSHNSCMEEALALFVERNARKSANKRLLVDLNSSQGLHDLFVREDLLQQWWLPPKDSNVRASLKYFGYLPSIEAGKDVVMESMRRFLRSKGASKLPASYNTCVAECLEVLSRNPDARTAFMRKPRRNRKADAAK